MRKRPANWCAWGAPKRRCRIARYAIELAGPRDPSVGVFYWVLGLAYFVLKDYDAATRWLQQSVDARGNLWFSGAYLVAAYALARRVGQARDALRQFYGRGFGWYTPRRIAEIYASELPNNTACAHRELYRDLGVAETDFSQRRTAS